MGEKQTIQGGTARVLQAYFWRKVSKTYPGETSRHRLFFTQEGKRQNCNAVPEAKFSLDVRG